MLLCSIFPQKSMIKQLPADDDDDVVDHDLVSLFQTIIEGEQNRNKGVRARMPGKHSKKTMLALLRLTFFLNIITTY